MQHALDQAAAFIETNPDEARAAIAHYTTLPPPVVANVAFPNRMGVDHQIVAPSPHLYGYWADVGLAKELTDTVNEAGTALVAQAGGRLSALALVSMQHPELAAT